MAKVLWVDDCDYNGDRMTPRRLQRKGFEMIYARDGEEAVQLAHSEQPDIILMKMSIKNSQIASQEIKTSPTTQHIPIIGLTAFGIPEDERLAIAAVCNDCENKPIEFPRLLEKMNHLLTNS